MKNYLKKVVRKETIEDKTKFKAVLSQNERNYKLPDSFFESFIKTINQKDIFFYPSTTRLKQKLSKYLNIETNNILLTPGSDIGIKTIFETFNLKDNNIISSNYAFPMYSVYADLYETSLQKIRYSKNGFNIRKILDKINKNTQFIILANPNSPLGDYYTFTEIKKLLDTGIHVIIDEAYIELTDKKSLVDKIYEYKNLTILRTFSKGYGAAGCRVGYLVSHENNIEMYGKFKFMYELSGISIKYCEFILDNINYFNRYIEKTLLGKKKTVKKLNEKGLKLIDTSSSWFFLKHTQDIENIFKKNLVSFRTIKHPSDNSTYIKLNYDLVLKNNNLINDLLNVQLN